jgi:hypothetical protein
MLNSFKVQNRLQAKSEAVKVFMRKYESYEKIPVNTIFDEKFAKHQPIQNTCFNE